MNDIDNGINSKLLKSNDTKMYGMVCTEKDEKLQKNDLSKLVSGSVEWQMLFNNDKCKVMHIGLGMS